MPREPTIRNRRLIQRPLDALKSLRHQEIDPDEGILPEACEIEMHTSGTLEMHLFNTPPYD